MKKRNFVFILAVLCMALGAHANVWTVGNSHTGADFTTLQEAIDGASSGDTLYIEGSPHCYGEGVFDKKLVVFGNGYFLNENDSTQANKEPSRTLELTFNPGSQGTEVYGLEIRRTYSTSGSGAFSYSLISINADSITLARNFIEITVQHESGPHSGASWGYSININATRRNISIKQNWILAIINYTPNISTTTTGVNAIHHSGPLLNNSVISNNFIRARRTHSHGVFQAFNGFNSSSNDLLVSNNIFAEGDIFMYYTAHMNNILRTGSFSGYNPIYYNNICNSTQYPEGNGNQRNVDMNTVFVENGNFDADKYWQLKEGSPAIGSGANGIDCGIFGGDAYVLSGLPPIPSIYHFSTVNTPVTTELPIEIKARSNR